MGDASVPLLLFLSHTFLFLFLNFSSNLNFHYATFSSFHIFPSCYPAVAFLLDDVCCLSPSRFSSIPYSFLTPQHLFLPSFSSFDTVFHTSLHAHEQTETHTPCYLFFTPCVNLSISSSVFTKWWTPVKVYNSFRSFS